MSKIKIKKRTIATTSLLHARATAQVPAISTTPERRAPTAQQLLQMAGAIARTVYPNGDPDFFKAPHALNRDKKLVANPYQSHTWVYAACSAIATNLTQLPKVLDLVGTKEQETITEHPVLSLLENPNKMMSGPTFWEAVILNLLLPTKTTAGGQCFLIMDSGTGKPVSLSSGDLPNEIFPFTDQYIEPMRDQQNHLTGWWLKIPNKDPMPFLLDEVIRINLYDPGDPLKGLSPLSAAQTSIRQDVKATELNENFFDNNASLGGTLETDAHVDDAIGKDLLDSFNEKYSGSGNAGQTALLHSGIKFQQFQQTHADMQFIEQRKFSRDEILAVYRVPKAEVSLYEDINFATAKSANKSFWEKTLLPHDKRILWSINNSWIKYIDQGRLRLISDLSNVEALQENFTEKLEQAKTLAAMYVPLEEINRRLELNLKIEQYAWLSTALVPFSLSPAEEVIDPAPEPEEPAEGDNIPPEKQAPSPLKIDKAKRTDFNKKYQDTVIAPDEKKMAQIIRKFFLDQRNRMFDLIDAWAGGKKAAEEDIAAYYLLRIKENDINPAFFKLTPSVEALRLRKLMLPEYQRQVGTEAAQMAEELGPFINWEADNPALQAAVKQRLIDIKSINTTTFRRARNKIGATIAQAVDDNLTVSQTAKLLKKNLQTIWVNPPRVTTIARTETGIIHSTSRDNIMTEEEIKKRQWATAQDELVRSASGDPAAEFPHDILDGDVIDTSKKEVFNNGEDIRFPLDPSASAGNIINCRCVLIGVR